MKLERIPVRGAVVATVVTLVLGFLYFYFALPAINIHNIDAYIFAGVLLIIWCSLYAMFSHSVKRTGPRTPKDFFDVDENGDVIRKPYKNKEQRLAIFSMKVPLAILWWLSASLWACRFSERSLTARCSMQRPAILQRILPKFPIIRSLCWTRTRHRSWQTVSWANCRIWSASLR